MLTDSELGRRNRDTQKEAFRQGYAGPELDLAIYTKDWGFDIRDIACPVYLWYGQTDRNVSMNMAQHYARTVHGSKLRIFPGDGHLISVTHVSEILKTLT